MTCGLSAKLAHRLETPHGGDAHPRDEVRIFAEGFLDASPAWVAGNIDDRRQRLVDAASARLVRRHRVQLLDEIGIERGAEADRLREAGRVHAARGRAGIRRERTPECRAGCSR